MRKNKFLLILILFTASLLLGAGCWFDNDLVRMTQFGLVEGFENEEAGTLIWLGIPYARPPVGDLRWKAPQDPEAWEGVRETKEFCDECAQMGHDPLTWAPTEPIGSEDCLYLNIYRPNNDKKNLPVYVWIHGGSNDYGGATGYDGSAIAVNGDLVVVTVQYRLGPFGWLTHPELRQYDPLNNSGNFGTLDHIKALTWIRNNIAAFGGDPKKVLITGESAGGHDVMNLVISPLAKGLFHRAMSQSGGMKTLPVAAGDNRAEVLIGKLMVLDGSSEYPSDVEDYLRGKSTEELIYGYWFASSPPSSSAYQDGFVIPGSVVDTINSGNYNRVPIILGSNQDEMKFFLPLYLQTFPKPTSKGVSWAYLWAVLLYGMPLGNVVDTEDIQIYEACAYFGSLNWRYNFVDMHARPLREQQSKVWAYHFRWDGAEGSDYQFIFGAAHATEIPFFFGGTTDIWGGFAFSPVDDTAGRLALSDAMMDYLAKFAKTGNPNGHGLPVWKKWSNETGESKAIVFDANESEAEIYMIDEEITAEFVDAEFWRLYLVTLADNDYRDYLFVFKWY